MKDLIIRILLAITFITSFALASGFLVWAFWNGFINLLIEVPHVSFVHSICIALLFDFATYVLAVTTSSGRARLAFLKI